MNQQLERLNKNIKTTIEIVAQMQMSQDHNTQLRLAEANISLDALNMNYQGQDPDIKQQLLKLECHNIHLILDEIVRNCLAYYSLAEQPVGTNEPAIGPVFAQQLLQEIDDLSLDLNEVKNKLHRYISAAS